MAEAARNLVYSNNINQTAKKIVHNKKSNAKIISKRKNTLLVSIYVLFAIISIASAIFILSNYQKITALNFEIRQVNAIISEAEKTNMNLTAEMENIKGNKDIIQEAKTKLGMVHPESDQIVYFTLDDNQVETKDTNLVTTIFSTLTGFND